MTHRDERGQSAILAVVLLVGIVAIGSVSIVVLGGVALQESKDDAEDQRIEQVFVQLDEGVDSVALGGGATRQVDFDIRTKEGAVFRKNTGRIVVSANGTEIANESFGSIEYRRDGSVYAYQAGGVWRGTGGDASMVASPQFHYRDGTLNLPIPTVSGEQQLSSGVVEISKNQTMAPVNNVGYVEGELVTVEIQSKYYNGWAQYLRDRTNNVAVSVDDANETVLVKLGRPMADTNFTQGVYATGGADGDVTVDNGSPQINGPVRAEGNISTGGSGNITGTTQQNVESDLSEIDMVIETKVDTAKNSSSITTVDPATTELKDGKTYFADSDVVADSQSIDVDLGNGDVTLILNGSLYLEKEDLNINNETGNASFKVYMTGDYGMKKSVAGEEDEPERLQIYGTSETTVYITGGSNTEFYGTIYAPRDEPALDSNEANPVYDRYKNADTCDGWDVCIIQGGSEIHGAIVGGPTKLGQSTEMTYDSSLSTLDPDLQLEDGLFPPPITFLHVSVHEVELEDGEDDNERIVVADHAGAAVAH
ncbi:DUF7289 family protein [Haloarchaeobius amylolyticus]|uniref:DUF7289 family protein n=1 Tax=Haloarchaeobius amylolyticus TaxID=1198296 RepID=UPI00227168AB|nr:hypothetical protein [Haloarchaeobius amylolyticus]